MKKLTIKHLTTTATYKTVNSLNEVIERSRIFIGNLTEKKVIERLNALRTSYVTNSVKISLQDVSYKIPMDVIKFLLIGDIYDVFKINDDLELTEGTDTRFIEISKMCDFQPLELRTKLYCHPFINKYGIADLVVDEEYHEEFELKTCIAMPSYVYEQVTKEFEVV